MSRPSRERRCNSFLSRAFFRSTSLNLGSRRFAGVSCVVEGVDAAFVFASACRLSFRARACDLVLRSDSFTTAVLPLTESVSDSLFAETNSALMVRPALFVHSSSFAGRGQRNRFNWKSVKTKIQYFFISRFGQSFGKSPEPFRTRLWLFGARLSCFARFGLRLA